jgi:hypothetical protein
MWAKQAAISKQDIKSTLMTSEKAKLNQDIHYIYVREFMFLLSN